MLFKYARYLPFVGTAACAAGTVAGFISGSWTPGPVLAIACGTLLIVAGTIAIGRMGWGRSLQAGTNAAIATVSILAILGALNFFAVRFGPRLDLTETQLFTLSPQTQQLVENLDKPLKVWVFARSATESTEELLDNYARLSEEFSYEVADPERRAGLARRFEVRADGEVYLERGDTRPLVQTLGPSEPLSEARLTGAIAKIQRDSTPLVFFLQGHGEANFSADEGGLAQAIAALEERGFAVEELSLAVKSAVPEDADAVVVAGPLRMLFPGEVQALQSYLDGGGSVMVMLDPQTEAGLEDLLEEWGVRFDDRLVVDVSGNGSVVGLGPETPLVFDYGEHPIVEAFGNDISIYPIARPVEAEAVLDSGIQASPLLFTGEQTWAESDPTSLSLSFDPEQDARGPLVLGYALSKAASPPAIAPSLSEDRDANDLGEDASDPTGEVLTEEKSTETETQDSTVPETVDPDAGGTESAESPASANGGKLPTPAVPAEENESRSPSGEARLVAIGNSTFATNDWFQQQLNGDVFLNSIEWLTNAGDQPLSIRPPEQTDRRIELSPARAQAIGWLALLLMPLLGIAGAVSAWLLRQ
ncbi:ABC-type uncharacterized transport system involved in gliding motility, auxiliary component [Rubidibacter lacunae KORDI 51-2]|uniref:ABC-type uncharacterized transport system involved in gliding motility, auxiliary component n=1 Tax=Rubidibacter lacunae KORDI 51-2 TaxID=582515 RepID=U5D5C9_9CHRO|nr:Gldg family protein [Rubidibacter lacunae]ERN39888.1 ABC-type uncharacterized transport system involved in gliding motility, auxiliary component [Rubidibacter lacunae KORDI 51-2]